MSGGSTCAVRYHTTAMVRSVCSGIGVATVGIHQAAMIVHGGEGEQHDCNTCDSFNGVERDRKNTDVASDSAVTI